MGNRIETQNRLIDATRQLILTEGVEGCSLEKICSQAGFSRGAFYSNFGTKEGLLAALAEDEYDLLIAKLRDCVQAWSKNPVDSKGAPAAVMENLLFEALDAIGIDQNLYILHSDLLMRSIRDPKWGSRLLGLNNEFLTQLGVVLETILQRAGRELTVPIRALTHSVIGIAMRAAGISAWRDSLHAHPQEYHRAASTPTVSNNPTGTVRPVSPLKINSSRASATILVTRGRKTTKIVKPSETQASGKASPGNTGAKGQVAAVASENKRSNSIADSPVRDIAEMILYLLYATSRPIK